MKKRFLICIAALLVAVMFAVLLAACGDGEQNNDNETAQNNGNGTTTAPGSDFAADITAWDVGVSVDSGQTLASEIDRQRLLEILRSATSWVVEATIEYSHSDTEQNYHSYIAAKHIRDGDDYVRIRDDKDHVVEYDETGSEDFVSDWSGYSVELYNFGTEIAYRYLERKDKHINNGVAEIEETESFEKTMYTDGWVRDAGAIFNTQNELIYMIEELCIEEDGIIKFKDDAKQSLNHNYADDVIDLYITITGGELELGFTYVWYGDNGEAYGSQKAKYKVYGINGTKIDFAKDISEAEWVEKVYYNGFIYEKAYLNGEECYVVTGTTIDYIEGALPETTINTLPVRER